MGIDVDHVFAEGGAIARHLSGFEPRPQQVAMARVVAETLDARARLMVEAGTGVGKSFAYLLPAIGRIVEHNERVVVSTHTINLQEQLIENDLPLLEKVVPQTFKAVLVKGRSNYVSLRRLKLASERQARLFADAAARRTLHMLEDWAYTTRDGSRSSLARLPQPAVWDHAQSDAHNCMGRKCPTYDQCFFQSARRAMERGDLLVCNHALFFSDLALRGRGVGFLPPYDHVILDEAHAVEEVAAEHFGRSLAESRVAHLLRLLYEPRRGMGFLATLKTKDGSRTRVDEAIAQTMRCHDAMVALFAALETWRTTSGPPSGRVPGPDVVPNPLSEPMRELCVLLTVLRERAAREADDFELNSYAARAGEIAADAELLLGQQIDGCVYFVDRTGGRRKPTMVLRCAAVDVAPILRERLFAQDASVVLTSATLATRRGDFTHLATRLGCDDAESRQLGSPFDFARQMRVIVDPAMPAPNDPAYVDRLVPRIRRLVAETDGGAFVLFTSFAMLEQAAGQLRPQLEEDEHPVLVQGADGPPGLLLRRFREDRRSVLLGTVSFWQGVDVRGEGLRNVIITRLPFEVPDRPIVEARHERIQEQGGNPFLEDQLPRAIIRFRQGIGRLIRSHTDRGLVAVLDPRIATRSYGRLFREAIPEGVEIGEEAGTGDQGTA